MTAPADSDAAILAALRRAIARPEFVTDRATLHGGSACEQMASWQARAALEVIRPYLRDGLSAAELVQWLRSEAADMDARSKQGLSGAELAALEQPSGWQARKPVPVVLEGERAHQRQLARSLTAALAHIAVMRPEIPL